MFLYFLLGCVAGALAGIFTIGLMDSYYREPFLVFPIFIAIVAAGSVYGAVAFGITTGLTAIPRPAPVSSIGGPLAGLIYAFTLALALTPPGVHLGYIAVLVWILLPFAEAGMLAALTFRFPPVPLK